MNGIGERAGNCALEEVVMALRTRAELFALSNGIDTTKLASVSRLVSRVTGSALVRNKAIVGTNAFAHESGIHQHGMMADVRTYEVMRPQDVGLSANTLVLGKHSGRHAVGKRARELGFDLNGAALTRMFAAFKQRADEIGALNDEEMLAILTDGKPISHGWSLTRLETRSDSSRGGPSEVGKTSKSRAVVVLELVRNAEAETHVAIGETTMEAAFFAVRQASREDAFVEEIEITQVGFDAAPDASAETVVHIAGASWRGYGQGPDPLWAGVSAFVDAFNRAMRGSETQYKSETCNEAAG